jgi:S1-C subfamily serine protease
VTSQFVWTCPKCARKVPNSVGACRCGAARPLTGPEPRTVAPAAPPVSAATLWETHRATIGAVASIIVVIGTVAEVWRSRPEPVAPPRRTPPPAVATVPAAEAPLPPEPPRDDEPAAASADVVRAAIEPMTMLSTEEIVTRSIPAVVTVETDAGLGSGFFVASGTVVTNAHVVREATSVTLRRTGGYIRAARVESKSYEIDLAILKVDVVDLDQTVLPLAAPTDVHIGAEVVAIGSPLGLTNSVTRGVVSGMRQLNGVKLIQTDAAINPGNSGGPLLDRYGRVLGVNTMKLGRGVEGMAFAVSIHYARAMLGAGFAPNPDVDARREDAIREYTEKVRVLAQNADAVDGNWKKFRSSCEPSWAPGDIEREWFQLSSALPPVSTASCRSWAEYFQQQAVQTRDALVRHGAAARAAGASPDRLRVVRRRFNMNWAGWPLEEERPR